MSETSPPERPWRPRVAALASLFFGVLAGGLVTAVSLRRMRAETKARAVLSVTVVIAVGLLALASRYAWADAKWLVIVYVLAGLVGAIVLPLLQGRDFREWLGAHPKAYALEGWRALGWSVLGSGILFGAAFLLSGTMAGAADAVETAATAEAGAEGEAPSDAPAVEAGAGVVDIDIDASSMKLDVNLKLDAPPAPGPNAPDRRAELERACTSGESAEDCFTLGLMWGNGQGGTRDLRTARKLVDRSCQGGYKEACDFLPEMIEP